MMKKISVLLAVVVLVSSFIIFNAFAAENLTFSVSDTTGYAGEEVKVNVNISNNMGIITFVLKLDYNTDILTLTNVKEKEFSGLYYSELLTDMPYQIQFGDTTHGNNTTNGTIVELTFRINDNAAPGVYPIIMSCDDDAVANKDLQLLPFTIENGTITVKDNVSVDSTTDTESNTESDNDSDTDVVTYTVGDINNDGFVTIADAVEAQKVSLKIIELSGVIFAVADVNNDGSITIADSVDILKFALEIDFNTDIGTVKQYCLINRVN